MDAMITVGYGSRGVGGSLAHYNPTTRFININRYSKTSDSFKPFAFISSGGISSFAHEYGHALDYILGGHVERNSTCFPLTLGRSTRRTWSSAEFTTPMRKLMQKLIHRYIWEDEKETTHTKNYQKIINAVPYYRQHNEIFARLFEKYIFVKLADRQIKNLALSKSKYDARVYATDQDMKKLIPLRDQLVGEIRKHIVIKSPAFNPGVMKPAASR